LLGSISKFNSAHPHPLEFARMSKQALRFLMALCLSTSVIGSAGAAQADPINWAQVIKLVNKVQFKPTDAAWRPAQSADRLQQSGEALFTSRGSRADLRLSEGSLLRMSSNTHLWIQPNSRNLLQRSGTALYVIRPGGGRTDISTPYGRAGVRGSALFVRVNEETGTMIVGALTNNPAGPMEVTTANGPKQTLTAGQMAVVRDGKITTFEFDLNTFYQTSSLVQGFGLDGKAVTGGDSTLADPEIQQTLLAVQAETKPALAAQKAVTGRDVAVNPGFLNSSSRDLKPADLLMQSTSGSFDRNSPQTAAGITAARQGANPVEQVTAAIPPPILPAATAATVPAASAPNNPPPATGPIVPLVPNPVNAAVPPPAATPPAPTVIAQPAVTPPAPNPTVVPPPAVTTPTTPAVITPVTPPIPDRTIPSVTPATPAIPTTPAQPATPVQPVQPIGQPNNPLQPIAQPVTAGQVAQPPTPTIIRVEIEIEKPSRVTPTVTPTVVAPRVESIVTPTVVAPPTVPSAPVAPTVVAPPTVPSAPVAPTVVAPPTVPSAPVAPTVVAPPTVPSVPVAPTVVAPPTVPSAPVAPPTGDRTPPTVTPAIVPITTPDSTLTAPK
jgi:FecR protein